MGNTDSRDWDPLDPLFLNNSLTIPSFFDVTGVVTFGKSAAGVINLATRATETEEAALVVGFPLTEHVPARILIEDGKYVSENYYGMLIGQNAAVTMCGGEVHGGGGNHDGTGIGFPGVGLAWGGEFNMADGHIVGSDAEDYFSYEGIGLVLWPGDSPPTATITGGTITGGSYSVGDGTYNSVSILAGKETTVHLAGGKLSGDIYVGRQGTIVVYGEKNLSYEDGYLDITYGFLNGKLCDGSELGNITVYGYGNVELKGCGDAPKINECGKKGKTGKGDAPHRTRQKASKAK